MSAPAEHIQSPIDERKLRRLETIEPTTVLLRGMQLEQQGHTEEAIACYRRSLALGLSWPGSVSNCTERLNKLLLEQGHAEESKDDPALIDSVERSVDPIADP